MIAEEERPSSPLPSVSAVPTGSPYTSEPSIVAAPATVSEALLVRASVAEAGLFEGEIVDVPLTPARPPPSEAKEEADNDIIDVPLTPVVDDEKREEKNTPSESVLKEEPSVATPEPVKEEPIAATPEPVKEEPIAATPAPVKEEPIAATPAPVKEEPASVKDEPAKDAVTEVEPVKPETVAVADEAPSHTSTEEAPPAASAGSSDAADSKPDE